MSKKNPEYDFKWCPGCGDFGVRRALELAMIDRLEETGLPMENNVVVAGIGCSGNLVHLLEGDQPYGMHGIHGRSLPIALGVKMARPELNVVVVAGDGDFLSIGGEHIGPQAARNLNITAVIMDNGVYGLTKGQSSPTTKLGVITSSTPYGKIESQINPLELYLTLGVSYVASGFSGQPRPLSRLIKQGMEHPGLFHRPRPVALHHLQRHLRGTKRQPPQRHRANAMGRPARPQPRQQRRRLRPPPTPRPTGRHNLQRRNPPLPRTARRANVGHRPRPHRRGSNGVLRVLEAAEPAQP